MVEISVEADCFPTEDRDKVETAMRNLFPDAVVEGEKHLVGLSSSLETFAEMLQRQRIRDAARAVMLRGAGDNSTTFSLNKQVAAVGKISFSSEHHALGDIRVTIISDRLAEVIDSITLHGEEKK